MYPGYFYMHFYMLFSHRKCMKNLKLQQQNFYACSFYLPKTTSFILAMCGYGKNIPLQKIEIKKKNPVFIFLMFIIKVYYL